MRWTVLSAAACACVSGWTTTSQARFGAQISGIQNESRGVVAYPVPQSLGYLWTFPGNSHSMTGLGGSITWAWDGELCDRIMNVMEEDFWEMSFIDCRDVRAALHRAFDTWAAHHKLIKFTDVSDECEKRGELHEGCALAEIWVTFMNESNPNHGGVTSYTAQSAAQAVPFPHYSPTFLSTNGNSPYVRVGTNQIPRSVIEVTGGRLSFNTDEPYCWYLDSSFCQGWHELKQRNGVDAVYIFSNVLLFFFWGVAMCVATAHTMLVLRGVLRDNKDLLDDLDPLWPRVAKAALLTCDSLGFYRLTMRLLLVMLPWAFYKAIFLTCWECYDFEAVAAHQIGHMLGLGQPNILPAELLPFQGPAGQNSYNWQLAAGWQQNSTNCYFPWDAVEAGIPPGLREDQINPSTGNRWALMDAIDKHNPRTCLTDDDLEGLNTLYPTCSGAITQPQCSKQSLYFLGWFRVCIFLIGPLIYAICTTVTLLVPFHVRNAYKERKAMNPAERAGTGAFLLQLIKGGSSAAPRARVAEGPSSSTVGVVEIVAPPPQSVVPGQDV